MNPVELDALALSRAIHTREVSCREVMTAYLDRIERVNPAFNALVSLRPREELLAEADAHDALLSHGRSLGWMHGMPQAAKDLCSVRGLPTTFGSPLFRDAIAAEDSLHVARARAAGALYIGKTNTPEFGLGSQTYNTVFGVTRNAFDRSLCAGGSSGGAAVALSQRLLPVADGSDMGGSLRNPAAYNNVYGMRPSAGRIPSLPSPECFIQQLATDGPMGRSVADVARLLSTQAGHDPRAPLSLTEDPLQFAASLERDMRGVKIGWLGDLGGHLPFEEGVLDLCRTALSGFTVTGAIVEDTALGFAPERLWDMWIKLRSCLVAGGRRADYDDPARRALLKPEAQWEVENGLRTDAAQVFAASVERTAWYRHCLGLFERFDFLALPVAQVFPFDVGTHWPTEVAGRSMDTYHRWMEVVIGPTLAGLPVISVPAGFDGRGRPMGVQLIGPPRGDFAVLQLARAWEQVHDLVRTRRPAAV